MQITLNSQSDKIGYPFFKLSSTMVWIVYNDGNKRIRWAMETNTTVSQIVNGRITNLRLDVYSGVRKLIDLVNKQSPYIKQAQIIYKGLFKDKDVLLYSFKNGQWASYTNKDIHAAYFITIPHKVINNTLIINLNKDGEKNKNTNSSNK